MVVYLNPKESNSIFYLSIACPCFTVSTDRAPSINKQNPPVVFDLVRGMFPSTRGGKDAVRRLRCCPKPHNRCLHSNSVILGRYDQALIYINNINNNDTTTATTASTTTDVTPFFRLLLELCIGYIYIYCTVNRPNILVV